MSDIYDEVLAEKKKLIEVAESNATNKIVDAIAPRIRELVESAILGNVNDEDSDILLSIFDKADNDVQNIQLKNESSQVAQETKKDVSDKKEENVELVQDHVIDETSLNALSAVLDESFDHESVANRVSLVNSKAKKLLSNGNVKLPKTFELVRQLKVECQKLYTSIQESKDQISNDLLKTLENSLEESFKIVMEHYNAKDHLKLIVKKIDEINANAGFIKHNINESVGLTAKDLKSCFQLMRETAMLHASVKEIHETLGDDDAIKAQDVINVGNSLATLYMEMKRMTTKKNKRKINEADELAVGGDEVAGVGDDAAEDGTADKLLVQLELPVNLDKLGPGDVVSVKNVTKEEDEEFSGLDEMVPEGSGDDEEMLLDEEMPEDESDEEMSEDESDEEMSEDESDKLEVQDDDEDTLPESVNLRDDDIIEIDEAALMAEMKRMKKLNEKKKATMAGGHGPGDLSDFGGGEAEEEAFVDGVELNDSDVSEARTQNVARVNRQQKKLAEAYTRLREELAEQKLFNTKLVALNRLLQYPNLKDTQKSKIVEILDTGKSVTDVQKLYTKISETLKKNTQQIKESASKAPAGGSSVVTTSSAPTKKEEENQLLERWQKIAFSDGVLKG